MDKLRCEFLTAIFLGMIDTNVVSFYDHGFIESYGRIPQEILTSFQGNDFYS